MTHLPDKSKPVRLPQSVVVVNDATYEAIERDRETVDLLTDPDSLVLPHSANNDSATAAKVRQILEEADRLHVGALLVRNPYEPESYTLADEAVEVFTGTKYQILAKVAGLLGAKRVKLLEAKVEVDRSSASGTARGTVKVVESDGSVERNWADRITSNITAEYGFDGGDPDLEAARAYLYEKKLHTDHDLSSLIELRDGPNLLRKRKVTLNATRESDKSLRAALKLANSGLIKVASIGAEFRHSVESLRKVELVTEIIF
jgi:hypothetical protein